MSELPKHLYSYEDYSIGHCSQEYIKHAVQKVYYNIKNEIYPIQWESKHIQEDELIKTKIKFKKQKMKKGLWKFVEINEIVRKYNELYYHTYYNIILIGPNNRIYQIDYNFNSKELCWKEISF